MNERYVAVVAYCRFCERPTDQVDHHVLGRSVERIRRSCDDCGGVTQVASLRAESDVRSHDAT